MPVLQIQKVSLQPRGSGPLQAALQAWMSHPAFSTWAQVPSEPCNSKVGEPGEGKEMEACLSPAEGSSQDTCPLGRGRTR